MVKEASINIPSKDKAAATEAVNKTQSLVFNLAALLYYDQAKSPDGKTNPLQFEDIADEEQKKYLKHSAKIFVMLDQLNKMVVDRVDPAQAFSQRVQDAEAVGEIIREFLKNVTKPKNVAMFFPVDELALRIVEGRKK